MLYIPVLLLLNKLSFIHTLNINGEYTIPSEKGNFQETFGIPLRACKRPNWGRPCVYPTEGPGVDTGSWCRHL